MADSKFSLSKVFSFLKGFLNTLASPLQGLNMADVKVNTRDDKYSVLFTFDGSSGQKLEDERGGEGLTDIKGNTIKLNVLLSAVNVKEAVAPLLDGMNKMSEFDAEVSNNEFTSSELLDVLLGKDREDNQLHERSGKGLLGLDPKDANNFFGTELGTYSGKTWSWMDIASKYCKYSLECQAEGKDYGAIENQKLDTCQDLISEYLIGQNVIDNANEVKVAVAPLSLPIMILIQGRLCEYYQDAYNKMVEGKSTIEQEGEATATADEVSEDLGLGEDETSEAAGGLNQSKHIDVTLQRIAGTTEFNMTMIKANYAPSLVLDDMDEIVGQPEFIDALPEDLTSYSIEVDDDGFDIEPCEECLEGNPCESLCEVFKAGIRAYRNLYIIHWMSNGNDMMKLHTLAEEMYGELIQEIDTIGELLVEKQGTVPQLDFPCDYILVQDYDFQSGLDQIQSLISMYIDCIDYAYCNQDSDVQSTLDEWLRYWKKQLNYFVERQEM